MDALICILEMLLISSHHDQADTTPDDTEVPLALGILDFQRVVEVYAYITQIPSTCRADDIHCRLKDDLLNDVHGIRCVLFMNRYKKNVHNIRK